MFYIFAFCVGIALAIQASINAALAKALNQNHLLAALISFAVGTLCLFVLCYFNGSLNLSIFKALTQQSWWKYLGGFLGAFIVFAMALIPQKIGLVNMGLLLILGQVLSSVVFDKIGAFGLEVREISMYKIIGLIVIFIGFIVFFYKDLLKT